MSAPMIAVTQTIHEVSKFEKRSKLMELLNETDPIGTVVFVETKRTADFLASCLSETDHPTTSIHSHRPAQQRDTALASFNIGLMKVLVITSEAAYNFDIPGLRRAIYYDLPRSIGDYMHRIDKIVRNGNDSTVVSFFDPAVDSQMVDDLVRVLREAGQIIPDFLLNRAGDN